MHKENKTLSGLRRQMVEEIRGGYALSAPGVLSVMLQIPRHEFVDNKVRKEAYLDKPVSIGLGQTMSQPYTVAFMTHLLTKKLKKFNKVLEVGTGSGYQAAILSKIFDKVYTIEILSKLAEKSKKIFKKLNLNNIYVKSGSGEWGWKENSPYDAIIVTAGMRKVPKVLFSQLNTFGVLVAPVGSGEDKKMTRYTKSGSKTEKIKIEEFGNFHFVPFVESKN